VLYVVAAAYTALNQWTIEIKAELGQLGWVVTLSLEILFPSIEKCGLNFLQSLVSSQFYSENEDVYIHCNVKK